MAQTALALLMAGGMLGYSASAANANFLQRLFGGSNHQNEEQLRQEQMQQREERLQAVAARTKVSAPRYYTYKPDDLTTVNLSSLAKMTTAAADLVPANDAVSLPVTGNTTSAASSDTAMPDVQSQADAKSADQTATDQDAPVSGASDAAATGASAPASDTSPKEDAAKAGVELNDAAPVTDAAPATPQISEFDLARPALKELRFKALPEVAEALESHYREHPAFLWITDGKMNANAAKARQVLAEADKYGLDPADYQVDAPTLEGLEGDALHSAEMAFEMHLSAAVATYALDAQRGRVDADRISGYHDLPRQKVDLVADLNGLSAASDVTSYLEGLQPQSAHFKALVNALAELRKEDNSKPQVQIADGTLIKPGNTDPELRNVVAAIRQNGSEKLKADFADTLSGYVDGDDYTPELVDLVKAFQKEKGLSADGVVGRNTIDALVGETNADKIKKIELAMERSRWLPERLGSRRVFINEAAFEVTYSEQGKAPLTMRVVVGQKGHQTNFFYDQIKTVEYNPYWGVPRSIIINELLPKLARDPSYLDKIGYEVTTASGQRVSSASVDWNAVATRNQVINVRQMPGDDNALGDLKILFPNKHAIYMHDTPSKYLFKRADRAYSHGCVRLADPEAMAAAVLGKSKAYVQSRIAEGQNNSEPVTAKIPVYLAYFTAWPDQNGTMHYYNDVYSRDMYLTRAMDATEKSREAARI